MTFLLGLLSGVFWFYLTFRVMIHFEFVLTYGVSVHDHSDGLLCVDGDAEVFLKSEAREEGKYPWSNSLRMRAGVGLGMWECGNISRKPQEGKDLHKV